MPSPRQQLGPPDPCLHLSPSAPSWLCVPSSLPWSVSPRTPPGCLIPPDQPQSVVALPLKWTSMSLAAPRPSTPLAPLGFSFPLASPPPSLPPLSPGLPSPHLCLCPWASGPWMSPWSVGFSAPPDTRSAVSYLVNCYLQHTYSLFSSVLCPVIVFCNVYFSCINDLRQFWKYSYFMRVRWHQTVTVLPWK